MSSPKPKMDYANLQIQNALVTAWQHKKQIYGSPWDISKAIDSVGRPLIRLAWERVGVPDEIIDWLIELDRDNHTVEVWEIQGYEGFANKDDTKVCDFDPERGTGQGDISAVPKRG